MRSRSAGAPAALAAAAAGALAAGLAAILFVAGSAVQRVRVDEAEAQARMAAALWELAGGDEEAVTALLGARGRIEPPGDGGAGADAGALGAPAYLAGDLEPAAWIGVDAPAFPAPLPAAAIALAGVLLAAAWAVRRRSLPPPSRYPAAAALLAAGLLAGVAAAAHAWAGRELRDLSAARLHQGVRAVEIATAAGAAPADAARAAGMPWADAAALDDPARVWTMPRAVAEAVAAARPSRPAADSAAAGPGARTVIRAGGASHHTASHGSVHLALPGYESIAAPTVSLSATAAAGMLAAALALLLLRISARPRELRRTLAAWGFIAPAGLLLAAFTFGPLLFSLWISLHDWSLADPAHPFVGLANYGRVLGDASWWAAVRNTAVFTLHVPVAMAVALALALLTRGSSRAARWARLALFLPGISSVVAIAIVWKWLLNDGYGLANRLLGGLGVGPAAWLTSPDLALASLMLIGVWMIVGYQMVVFQAGLAAIPRDWHDAARVDGAGPLQRFRHVTLPGLRGTLFFVLVTSVIGSFQVFGLVYVMTEGGPLGATDVAVYHIYREAWEFLSFGSAAAMSWVLFAIVFAATWLHFRLLEGRSAHA